MNLMKKNPIRNSLIACLAIFIGSLVLTSCGKNDDGVTTDTSRLLALTDSCRLLLKTDTTGFSPAAKTAYALLEDELTIVQFALISPTLTQKQVNTMITTLELTKTTLETTIALSFSGTTASLNECPDRKKPGLKNEVDRWIYIPIRA